MPVNNRGALVTQTRSDIASFEMNARETVEELAVSQMDNVASPSDVHVRQLLPGEDLDEGDDNEWEPDTEDRRFVQYELENGENDVYEIDSNGRAQDKIVAVVGITNVSSTPVTTQLEFRSQTGGIYERQNLQGMLTDQDDTILFADPIVFGKNQDGVITQFVSGLGDDEDTTEQLVFHGIVAEQEGETLEPSKRFMSYK